jgi:(E)-4-hydroxy-3-methylbut-2-enyl-diphosphate synthase
MHQRRLQCRIKKSQIFCRNPQHQAGAEIIRMTVNDAAAAKAVPLIRKNLVDFFKKNPPQSPFDKGEEFLREDLPGLALVGDFHFNGHILLEKFPEMARALDKFRINPGNAKDDGFRKIVETAIKYNKPVRIGVNGGSLDPEILGRMMEENGKNASKSSDEIFVEAMVESALRSAELAEKIGLPKNRIVLSVKASNVPQVVKAYEFLAQKSDYALHLGLTEAGAGMPGIVSTSAALGILLHQNIGDTIRVSLTPTPSTPRTEEVKVAQQILQSLGLKSFRPHVTSCPGCGRTTSTFFQTLAEKVNQKIDDCLAKWKTQYPGIEDLQIAVMGCVVNGPGESKHADIAISLPGKMEQPMAPVYIDGEIKHQLKGERIEEEFFEILEGYIQKRFGVL